MTTRILKSRLSAASTLCIGAFLVVLVAGCMTLPRKSASSSGKTGSIRRNETRPKKLPPAVLAAEVGRFADELTELVAQAADSFAAQVGTPQARATALSWKTGAASTSLIIAAGPNPTANLLDMVVLVTLERMTFEEYWLPHYGKPVEPIVEVTRQMEEEIWSVAERVLTPHQVEDLHGMIREWRAKHPEQIYINVRFRDFADLDANDDISLDSKPGSVFSLLFLDPFAGLDPATRQLNQTRFVAERALYVFERMPKLLRWQSELVIAQALTAPQVQQLVSNTTTFARSAEQLTQAVQTFPEQFSVERDKMMKDIAAQSPEWQTLLSQFQQTFQAGNAMAVSVDAAVKSLDAFIERAAPSPPASAHAGADDARQAAGIAPSTAKPFDISEYGAAASQIAIAARELDALTHSLEKSTPQISAVVERTGLQGKELADYTFRKALWFLLLALAGFVLALLAYRWIASRLYPKTKGTQP